LRADRPVLARSAGAVVAGLVGRVFPWPEDRIWCGKAPGRGVQTGMSVRLGEGDRAWCKVLVLARG